MTCFGSRCSSILSATPHIFETTLTARHYSRRAEKFLAQHAKALPVAKKKRQRSRSLGKRLLAGTKRSNESSSSGSTKNSAPSEQFWKSDWGEDKLKPSTSSSKKGALRSHQPGPPILFSRRIEGLIESAEGPALEDLVPPSEHNPIAKLSHNLDRVLFNPGTHWLRDPRSRVYNFTPWLESIPRVSDFAFERLQGFIKSSRDEDLRDLAIAEQRPFAGSTSSLTGMLSQIYFLLSQDKPVNTDIFSADFRELSTNFTPGQRMPASVIFNYKDGVYAIDSDSDASASEKNILTWMGTLLEKMLTTTRTEFMGYMRQSQPPLRVGTPKREAYRYAKSKRLVMRSQLDCHDSRLPGTGVFDIKTRACLPIRLDILNFEENSGYLIRSQHGLTESFEREYYDLIRSAFLKYSFQARIGNMDGVLVAYHNTARLFGFQYVPLEEMDQRLFGPAPGIGDRVFDKCLNVLEIVAEEIIRCFPKQSVKCTLETEEGSQVMNVWVQPVSDSAEDRIQQLQVKIANYFEKEYIHGHSAISENANEAWTVRWSVGWLCNSPEEMRKSLEGAKDRQFRAYNYPTGIGPDEMPEFWKNLNFGSSQVQRIQSFEGAALENKSTWSDASFKPENFKAPSGHIMALRQASRNGKKITEQMEEEDAGKTKIVLGSATYDLLPTYDLGDSPLEFTGSSGNVATALDVAAEDLPNLISEGVAPKTRFIEVLVENGS